MKALLNFKSVIDQSSAFAVIALTLTLPLIFPKLALADTQTSGQQPAQIFEIKVTNPNILNSDSQQNHLTMDDIQKADPLFVSVQNYLQINGSPLQGYTSQLLSHRNWKMILAISFVESNMCQHNYYYNCSGIGGQKYLRKYNNYGEWIDDMSNLLATHYHGWTLDKMDGVYVQPYSSNWQYGSKKIMSQLNDLEETANATRVQIAEQSAAQNQNNKELATLDQ